MRLFSKKQAKSKSDELTLHAMSDDDIDLLLKRSIQSKIVLANGPNRAEQVKAIVRERYWTVFKSFLFRDIHPQDQALIHQVNALKNSLQTYGPNSEKLPELRQNLGQAKGSVFHAHVSSSSGCTYVVEWAIVDVEKKQLAITQFGPHENFPFTQAPLSKEQINNLRNCPENRAILEKVQATKKDCIKKLNRLYERYEHLLQQGTSKPN